MARSFTAAAPEMAADVRIGTVDRTGTRPPARYRLGDQTGPPNRNTLDHHGRVQSSEQVDRRGRLRRFTQKEQGDAASELREVKEDFTKSIKGDLSRLVDLANGSDDERQRFQRMINHPAYAPYKRIYDRFVGLKAGSEEAGVSIRTFDTKALEEYFTSDAGFFDAIELRKIKVQEMALNNAAELGKNLPPPGPAEIEDQEITIAPGGRPREALRRLHLSLQSRLTTHGREMPLVGGHLQDYYDIAEVLASATAGTALWGGVAGTLLGGPLGGVAGAAAGAGIPAVVARVAYSFRRGERITVRQVREALETIQTMDPVRREWGREMYNVDSDNLGVDAQGHVGIRADIREGRQLANPSKDAGTIRNILVTEFTQIEKAQRLLGIPQEQRGITGMSTQAIEQPSQRDEVLEIAVDRQLKRELIDGAGHPCQLENPPGSGNWVDNPAFDLQNVHPQNFFNLRQEIHRRLLAERLRRNFRLIDEEKVDRLALLDRAIADRESAHAPGGSVIRERTAHIDRDDRLLTEDQRGLQNELDVLNDINDDLKNITEQRRSERTARGKVHIITTGTGITDPLAALTQALRDTGTPPFEIEIPYQGEDRRISGVAGRETAERARHDAALSAISPTVRTYQYQIDNENARHLIRMAEINEDKAAIRTAREAITNARQATETAQEALSTKAERERIQAISQEMQRARAAVESFHTIDPATGAVLVDLSTNALQTESFDTLRERINDANTLAAAAVAPGTPVTIGWPPQENDQTAHRIQLLHAMAEARAALHQPRIDAPTVPFQQAIDISLWNINESVILVSSRTQLEDIFRQRDIDLRAAGITPPGVPNASEIEALQQQAQLRFQARQQALQERVNEITGRKVALARDKERIEREVVSADEVKLIKDIRSNIATLGATILGMPEERLVQELDPGPPNPRTSTEFEQTSGLSGGFLWLLNEMTHYKNSDVEYQGTRGNEGAFNRARAFLTEDAFRDLMTPYFDLQMPGGVPPATFAEAINIVRTELNNPVGRITKTRFAEFLINHVIVDYLGRRVPVA